MIRFLKVLWRKLTAPRECPYGNEDCGTYLCEECRDELAL